MEPLSQQYTLVGGQMSCAALRPLSTSDTLVLAIHGGPGLSGAYLRPFLARLAETVSINAALLDLPNHGHSVIERGALPLTYHGCLSYLELAIREISGKCGRIILLGQSFGARLAVDLLAGSEIEFKGAILTGMPARFSSSSKINAEFSRMKLEPWTGGADTEGAFARNWRKILPLYTAKPLPAEVFEGLASGTRWTGNEKMTEDAPALTISFSKLMKRSAATRLLFVQGEKDIVVPDGNDEELRRMIPTAKFHEVLGAGHFVMLEEPETSLSLMADFIRRLEASGA